MEEFFQVEITRLIESKVDKICTVNPELGDFFSNDDDDDGEEFRVVLKIAVWTTKMK